MSGAGGWIVLALAVAFTIAVIALACEDDPE